MIDRCWCTSKSHACALLCLAFDTFSSPSASMPLALCVKITVELPMIKLEADFDLWDKYLQGKCIKHKASMHAYVSQCWWTVLSTMVRWCKVNALRWHFWQGSINTPPTSYIPKTLLTYFPTDRDKQIHQLALHNIRVSIIHTNTFVFFYHSDCN